MLLPNQNSNLNSGIYQIKNFNSGKFYIGSSNNLQVRWRVHRSRLNRGVHGNRFLQASWGKNKPEGFEFSVLLFCEPFELIRYETALIGLLQSDYNIAIPGVNPMMGKSHTEESKLKMSEAKVGKSTRPPEEVKRLAIQMKGNTYARGYKHTPQDLEKMRLSHIGKKMDYTPSPENLKGRSERAIEQSKTRQRDEKGRWIV